MLCVPCYAFWFVQSSLHMGHAESHTYVWCLPICDLIAKKAVGHQCSPWTIPLWNFKNPKLSICSFNTLFDNWPHVGYLRICKVRRTEVCRPAAPCEKKLQVTVGVDPDVVITRESQILVQVHAAVNETRNGESQIRSEASAATCG